METEGYWKICKRVKVEELIGDVEYPVETWYKKFSPTAFNHLGTGAKMVAWSVDPVL